MRSEEGSSCRRQLTKIYTQPKPAYISACCISGGADDAQTALWERTGGAIVSIEEEDIEEEVVVVVVVVVVIYLRVSSYLTTTVYIRWHWRRAGSPAGANWWHDGVYLSIDISTYLTTLLRSV